MKNKKNILLIPLLTGAIFAATNAQADYTNGKLASGTVPGTTITYAATPNNPPGSWSFIQAPSPDGLGNRFFKNGGIWGATVTFSQLIPANILRFHAMDYQSGKIEIGVEGGTADLDDFELGPIVLRPNTSTAIHFEHNWSSSDGELTLVKTNPRKNSQPQYRHFTNLDGNSADTLDKLSFNSVDITWWDWTGARIFFNTDAIFEIDVKPQSVPSCFKLNGHGTVPVAILGNEILDLNKIDVSTLNFSGLELDVLGNGELNCSIADVSGDFVNDPTGAPDGYDDLVCHFVDDAGWNTDSETEASLTGEFTTGESFEVFGEICLR